MTAIGNEMLTVVSFLYTQIVCRRRWNERTPNNRLLAVSDIPDQMATRRGELNLALSFNDRFRFTTLEEIMTRRGEFEAKI